MYLLHMTTPTTDNIFPTTPTPISKLLPVIWNISAVNKPIAQFGRELLIITRIIPTLLVVEINKTRRFLRFLNDRIG